VAGGAGRDVVGMATTSRCTAGTGVSGTAAASGGELMGRGGCVHSGRLDGVVCRAHGVNADVGVLQGRHVVALPGQVRGAKLVSSMCVRERRLLARWDVLTCCVHAEREGWPRVG
jgi:hypothetical protein